MGREGVVNFDKIKRKGAICKYEHNYNSNKVKNYTVDNVTAYNNKTIRNMGGRGGGALTKKMPIGTS